MTSDNIAINSTNFQVDKNGNMTCNNAKISAKGGSNTGDSSGLNLKVTSDSTYRYAGMAPGFAVIRNASTNYINFQTDEFDGEQTALFRIQANNSYYISTMVSGNTSALTFWHGPSNYTQVANWGISTPSVTQTSKAEEKKNFEKLENGLDIIKNTDIYKYNFKSDEDTIKKHIGFVIGDNYNYSEEITSNENDGVDLYSFVSVCCKAIQEQQEEIEQLKEQIKVLEEK